MKLYVCYTRRALGHEHSCANAYEALRVAGYEPEVVRAFAFGGLPALLQTRARKRVKRHTGSYWVPALEIDDGDWISGSEQIVRWAEGHPAGG